ncbi:MAG: rhodanese-like domain-containing protein [Actinomycetota bacterium]|nr:rhodanese-like domain-containing protein [Actinomycetota bacterium]
MTDEATLALDPARARELIDGGAQVVDVRTANEHAVSHIEGAAHVPLERLDEEAEELDRERPLVVYCRGGNRSAMAAEALRNSGWEAHSIDGGLVAWTESGLPVEPEGAEVAPAENLPPR